MLDRIKEIGVGIQNRRQERERALTEKVDTFFGFMRLSGVNVDELEPKHIETWFRRLRQINISADGRSLDLVSAFHHHQLWIDSQIKFELVSENEAEKQLVVHVNQSAAVNPHYVGDLTLSFAGEIEGISQIRSVEDQEGGVAIYFKNAEGLVFDLLPAFGGIIWNFTGDRKLL